MTWFPPSTANPLPVVVVSGGADPGTGGWYPPSRQNPLPVRAVPGVEISEILARLDALEAADRRRGVTLRSWAVALLVAGGLALVFGG